MRLVYLTGSSGVGKTAVGEELRRRGFAVYDVDADGLARWFENGTRAEVRMPPYRDDAWFAENKYRLPAETVRRIADEADGVAFICGTVGNDNEIWDLFDTVISLSVDAATLRRRLVGRRGAFGSSGPELERVLAWHAHVDADNSRYGALLVDANAPIPDVTDRVLDALGIR
ncbi:AAA domain-containing protein [Kribbella sp. VKM Ac-2569]|uniref:AAA family ATPase n=1 Tax=Kribbella sp. VKM Ac-2569 TaxID=2512220 RepID=UPI00102ADA92|nr:AAA family ATPase [Kribbella sp. VKM Ac-2569]RZT15063.1 AAA domain-containing protein [Kribbella sp. VKM Ac-2569]